MNTGFGGLHRVVLVMNRRGRTGEVVDFVDLDIERKRHVVAHQLEARMAEHVLDVALRAGKEIVEAQHIVPALDQPVAQVTAQKPCATGDEDALDDIVLAGHR